MADFEDCMTIKRPPAKSVVRRYVPITDWLPSYKWGQNLRWDVIAGLTVWALLVPQAMAYAGIAGVPAEAGLHTAPLALLGYAIFGTSKQLFVGPAPLLRSCRHRWSARSSPRAVAQQSETLESGPESPGYGLLSERTVESGLRHELGVPASI